MQSNKKEFTNTSSKVASNVLSSMFYSIRKSTGLSHVSKHGKDPLQSIMQNYKVKCVVNLIARCIKGQFNEITEWHESA